MDGDARDFPSAGLVDLGSNSVRLLVFRINPNKSYTILTRHKQMVRLGEGAFASKHLSDAAMDRTVEALQNIADICRGYNVVDTVAYATAAVRDAQNGSEFVERADAESGIRFAVISGLEEARLIHLGVSTGLSGPQGTRLFIDIGGGSTELIVGRGSQCLHLDSLRLGSVRVAGAFPQTSLAGSVPTEIYEKIRTHVRNNSLRSVYAIRDLAPEMMVGSSGTIQNLAEIAARSGKGAGSRGEADGDAPALSASALAGVAQKLCSMPLEERRKIPGINPQRADIIIAGAAILQTLMEELGMAEIRVSSRGLLDGMLQDYLSRGKYGYLDDSMPTRGRSVMQLARSCSFNERHARWIERLALELFDSARGCGLHSFGANERELLRYAALLHDIGIFLSYDDHHSHSRYMIKNSELLGFNQREIAVMANSAYFHRKWSGKRNRSDSDFNVMSAGDRKLAKTLGLFLRMSEGLDRSQRQTVRHARITRASKRGDIELRVALSEPSPIELYSAERAAGQFKKIFGSVYRVTVSHCPPVSCETAE